ncbi:MAG TPA: hypothetical protein PL196_02030 [Burkholderiaceae bacterium]|nr:hypothetical protein [Burkholderiaceae bacterium]
MTPIRTLLPAVAACVLACAAQAQGMVQSGDKPVYRCPGTPVLYTDALTAQEAKDKGCRTIEGTAITVVPSVRPRTSTPVASGPRPAESKVDPAEQRARDSDARRILETELRKDESTLAQMLKDYNNGEPERLGDERNYQKYQDRVAQMKAAITRKESDIAALKRELAKLPP